jgi:redox-sensitive bicupin YhaK (pirin superfamily)
LRLAVLYDRKICGIEAEHRSALAVRYRQGELHLHSQDGARLLLIAGKPLGEPIVQYGPFVMNTREEIEQALRDLRDGVLA